MGFCVGRLELLMVTFPSHLMKEKNEVLENSGVKWLHSTSSWHVTNTIFKSLLIPTICQQLSSGKEDSKIQQTNVKRK